MKWVLLLAFVLTGCGHTGITGSTELVNYVQKFKKEGARFGKNLEHKNIFINFADLGNTKSSVPNGKVIGRCFEFSEYIEIDQEYWESTSETRRELLIFHELGHCWLNKDHSSNAFSIMYESVSSNLVNYYLFHRDEELAELFNG